MKSGCLAQVGVIEFYSGGDGLPVGGALGKYDPLRDHLAGYGAGDEVQLTFSEVEELVGRLPLGARRLRQWWANGSTAQAQAWRAAGWRVLLVDMATEKVLFARAGGQRKPATSYSPAAKPPSPFQEYLSQLHLPLLVVLVFLCVILGAIGFGLRPGTDEPPAVSDPQITLYVFQQKSATAMSIDPTLVSVDETMIQENSSTVLVQIDLFASFVRADQARWNLLTGASQSQPYSCPDPYNYLGTARPNPVSFQNAQVTIGGQPAPPAVIANFVGHRETRTASNVLGLQGRSPGAVPANVLAPIAEVNLCWTRDLPMAVDGEFTSAALPIVVAVPEENSSVRLDVTRSLYFENPAQRHQPITAEYALQAGTLPDSTDPFGWHWSSSQGGLVQVTAENIPISQHEAYLGFVSGVLFGIVGGAIVLVLQEILEPIRRRRHALPSTNVE
jgi:hypothetical protein